MNKRQIVPKKLAIAILAILFFSMLSITVAMGQSPQARDHAKLQKSVEWENYQATWKKVELEKAKDNRKDRKFRQREERNRQRFFAKMERIKQ